MARVKRGLTESEGRRARRALETADRDVTVEDITGDVPAEALTAAKSLAWFAGASSPRYLAEKFGIQRSWDRDAACAEILRWADEPDSGLDPEALREITRTPSDGPLHDEVAFYEGLSDAGACLADGLPGYVLPPTEMAMLEAIRRTYVRLSS